MTGPLAQHRAGILPLQALELILISPQSVNKEERSMLGESLERGLFTQGVFCRVSHWNRVWIGVPNDL